MLNLRLYRTSWIVAGVALIVALLTLDTPPDPERSDRPAAFDGSSALTFTRQLRGVAAERPAGSEADSRAAEWVQARLDEVPGDNPVQTQEFEARTDRGRLLMRNHYLVLPGPGDGGRRGGILVVAPRDTPSGVRAGASATGVMLVLADLIARTNHRRPFLFVSTDGSTVGNAGMRWFLARFSSFDIDAAVVLDDPGAAAGDVVEIWSRGTDGRAALDLARLAAANAEPGARADPTPSLGRQLIDGAVPQTFGDQGPVVAEGIPAVTLSARRDSPLRRGPDPTVRRLDQVGNAAFRLLGVLDGSAAVPGPTRSVTVGEQTLRPGIARVALFLLALPVLVAAADLFSRLRRARIPLSPGALALTVRAAPALAVVIVGYLMVLAGLIPGLAAGGLPQPQDVPLGATAGLGVAVAALAGVGAYVLARHLTRRVGASPASEAAAALMLLAALLVLTWVVRPYTLILALPVAHAALLATAATRRAAVAALVAAAAVPLLVLVATVSAGLDRNPFFAAWYTYATSVAGVRGAVGYTLAAALAACLWALAALVVFRARKGLVLDAAARSAGRRARPAAGGGSSSRW